MIPSRRQQAQPGQWQSNWSSNWQSPQNDASMQDDAEKSAGTAVTTSESQPEPSQEQESDDSATQKGKSALAPTLTIFIVLALIGVACLYWTRRRKRFVKDEQKKLEVETISSTDKDEKDSMFDRMESPPPIHTRSSSLVPSTRNSAYDYNDFNDYSFTAPTVRFAGAQIPSRSSSVSNLSMSNTGTMSNAGTASNRSSMAAPYRSSVMLPPKTYTPFEDTVRY